MAVGAIGKAAEVMAAQLFCDGLLDLSPLDQFRHVHLSPGDLNGDSLHDLLLGANLESLAGALHVFRLSETGQVLEEVVLSDALTGP